jgi:hypothetical protein
MELGNAHNGDTSAEASFALLKDKLTPHHCCNSLILVRLLNLNVMLVELASVAF